MEDKKSLELMEKNAIEIEKYKASRLSNSSLMLNYFKRILKYLSLGNFDYALYAAKRAAKVALTQIDDEKEMVSSGCRNISKKERLVIYTVLFGNYDEVKEPLYITPNCDYYILTDQEVRRNSVWKKYPLEKYDNYVIGFSNLEKARFFKLHPHILFPEYKYSMFIDANIQMVTDMRPVFKLLGNNFIAIHNQPGRDCVYQEATEIIVIGKASKDQVLSQVKAYKKEGFPKHYGLFRTCVVVREHNNEICRNLMNVWWENINKYSKRDQLSFTYALWKLNLQRTAVSYLGYDLRTNPRFIESKHR